MANRLISILCVSNYKKIFFDWINSIEELIVKTFATTVITHHKLHSNSDEHNMQTRSHFIQENEQVEGSKRTKPHLSYKERVQIWTLRNISGWTPKMIAGEMKCTEPTVAHWSKADHFDDGHKKGRPREIDRDHFMELQRSNQEYSCADIVAHWNDHTNLKLPSLSKVKLLRKEFKFNEMRNREVHHFTQEQMDLRVRVAKHHQGKLKKRRVIYVDETSRGKQASCFSLCVYPGDNPNYTRLSKIKGYSGHFVAGICWSSKTPLIYYTKKLNSQDYQAFLDHYVIPLGRKEYGPDKSKLHVTEWDWKLCQDSDGAHTSNDTKDFLETSHIELWEHPPWSPDMNPIEHVWQLLFHEVAKRRPSSNEQVVEFAKEAWKNFDQKKIQNIIEHLDSVYQWIIDHNGALYRFGK
jgi:transposase